MATPSVQKGYQFPPLAQRKGLEAIGQLRDLPIPEIKASEVLVKVHAVSLNYRDLVIAKNTYPQADRPTVPTSDLSGVIARVGADVEGWKEGEHVSSCFSAHWVDGEATMETVKSQLGGNVDGGLQQYIALPAHALVRPPRGWSHIETSTLPCAAVTAYNALFGQSGHPLRPGDTVLVLGTGGVSIFALQIARAAGATVIATSSSDEKLKLAQKLGANHLINYKKTPEWGDEVLKITNGEGVHHVIEVGGPGTIEQSFKACRYCGVISTIGFVSGGEVKMPNVPLLTLMKGIVLRGTLTGSTRQYEQLVRLIDANGFKPVVDKVFKFEEALEALKYLESAQHVGKVVIQVASD